MGAAQRPTFGRSGVQEERSPRSTVLNARTPERLNADLPLIEARGLVKEFVVQNKMGIHARPAAMIVRITNKFKAEVFVEKDDEQVNGKSIMGLMMLAAGQGSKLKICCEGADADKVMEDLEELIRQKFNED